MSCHLTEKSEIKGKKGDHPPPPFSPFVNTMVKDEANSECPQSISSAVGDCEQLRKAFTCILSSSFPNRNEGGCELFFLTF